MGTISSKPSKKKFQAGQKKRPSCCCPCLSRSSSNSYSSSSFSIDEQYLPTFDRLLSKNKHRVSEVNSNAKVKAIANHSHDALDKRSQPYYFQSIENLEKSLHGTASIDRWIDSLPILGTPSLNRPSIQPTPCSLNENDAHFPDNESLARILSLKSNRSFLSVAKTHQLHFHLKDFRLRLNNWKIQRTLKDHFSSSPMIYPCSGHHQRLADTLHLSLITPPESVLPSHLTHPNGLYQIREQLRSKCYFIPLTSCKIEPADGDGQQPELMDEIQSEPRGSFVSRDGFQTGRICFAHEQIPKEFSSLMDYSSNDGCCYLSPKLIRQWLHTLLLVNQSCAIAKRFLIGDGSHITFLVKEPKQQQNSSSLDMNLTFAALRLPPYTGVTDSSLPNPADEKSQQVADAFSPTFLSDRSQTSNNTIHLDYEQYSFAFILHRWPRTLIHNYHTHPSRCAQRKWPTSCQMTQLLTNPLLILPSAKSDHWEIQFDFIEQDLFALMNDSSLFFYLLCQQLFSRADSTRPLIKHAFLNHCEKFGLPFSKSRHHHLGKLLKEFSTDLTEQIQKQFIPHYFNPQINLFDPDEDYLPWLQLLDHSIEQGVLQPSPRSSIHSNRTIMIEFLFHFINQLYQTFHQKRSQFHLNDQVLLELHQQLCNLLANDANNNLNSMSHLLNNEQLIDQIQKQLTSEFDINAELVHTCLNQIRKSQTSLIFHYTWTIYIQYLHTYYNVLWNV